MDWPFTSHQTWAKNDASDSLPSSQVEMRHEYYLDEGKADAKMNSPDAETRDAFVNLKA